MRQIIEDIGLILETSTADEFDNQVMFLPL